MNPNNEKKATVTAALAPEKRRLRNRPTSSIGAAARRSTSTNATSSATPSASRPSVWAPPQPASGASITAKTTMPIAAVDSSRPGRSSGGVSGSREVGTIASARPIAASDTGTLTKNVHSHERPSSSAPPANRPAPAREPHRRAPQADRRRARTALTKHVRDDRQRRREDHRRADPHDRPRADELGRGVHEPRRRIPRSIDHEAGNEHLTAADPVAEAAGGKHQRGERER